MTTTIKAQITALEQAYKERIKKPLLFEAANQELRNSIREYCRRKGIN
jgi:hypothetical protein